MEEDRHVHICTHMHAFMCVHTHNLSEHLTHSNPSLYLWGRERGMWRRRQSESKGRSDPAEKNPSPHSNCCYSVAKLGSTLCDLMDCSLPGSSVHGISQTRILERIAISFSRESYQSRDQTHVSCISRWIPYHWATRETHCHSTIKKKKRKRY